MNQKEEKRQQFNDFIIYSSVDDKKEYKTKKIIVCY